MEAKAYTPSDLFDGRICYEIPPYQRPYVWSEDDQWQPLWDDLTRLIGNLRERPSGTSNHFLGAVVLKQLPSGAGDPSRHSVIDGQQRLTTLQILLDAAQLLAEQRGAVEAAEALEELVLNSARRFENTAQRFKLWPSRLDRPAFEYVMDNGKAIPVHLRDARIAQAHEFFQNAIIDWIGAEEGPDLASARIDELAEVLQSKITIVTINLDNSDDDQLIFETLNDRGTPLLAADLVKNYLFQRGEELAADVDAWSEKYWADFDDDWWRDEVSQGRSFRARIDLFLQYWLTMRTQSEVPTDLVFSHFRAHASTFMRTSGNPPQPPEDLLEAEAFMAALRRDADTFRELVDSDSVSPARHFYGLVVEDLELGATMPLLLWLVSGNHHVPESQAARALEAVESWVVRRTLLRLTMKNVNNSVVSLLQKLGSRPTDDAGEVTEEFLAAQDADSTAWPTDDEVRSTLPSTRLYGSVKQQRLRAILAVIEKSRRTERNESVSLPPKLELEHVMPRDWRAHWGRGVTRDAELAAARDALIHTLGNLTLVTHKLNKTLSNRPWTDSQAAPIAPIGKYAGEGKRNLLKRFSLLVINKEIVDEHPKAWTDEDIAARGADLTESVISAWPRRTISGT